MNTHQFYAQARSFTTAAITAIEDSQLFVSNYELDHLCYRVQDERFYHSMKSFLQQQGSLLAETQINGREISTYKLKTAVVVPGNPFRQINLIELPASKKDKMYPTGFEHLEFVVPDIDHLKSMYPTRQFVWSNPGGINPTVSLKYSQFTVKFHERSLEDVIAIEKLSPKTS